jgi:chemotaxis response regulator CheB
MGPALRFLRRIVHQAGHEVVGEAWNGKQAVDFCAELLPDVVVLDNSMPVMTGIEAAQTIHRDKTAKQIIAVTTLMQVATKRPFLDLGCIVIPKSDEDAFLLRAIAQAEAKLNVA